MSDELDTQAVPTLPKTTFEQQLAAVVDATNRRLQGLEPKWNFVIVRIERAEKTSGGILLPENQKQRPVIGRVIAVGPDAKHVAKDERVLFGKYAGIEVELPNGEKLEDHRILRDVEIYGGFHAPAAQ